MLHACREPHLWLALPTLRRGRQWLPTSLMEARMSYHCKTCGAVHPERPTCFGFEMPAVVSQLSDAERARRVAISSDQCILDDEHYFILGTLDLPIQGSDEVLRWIAWSTLSRISFERADELWTVDGRESEPPYFGWLSNRIPGFPDSLHIKVLVHTEPLGCRPRFEVVEDRHPLGDAQRRGITGEKADELIHVAQFGAAATPQQGHAPHDSGAQSR